MAKLEDIQLICVKRSSLAISKFSKNKKGIGLL